MLEQITPLILTYNEAPNIRRSLQALTWAKQIIIIDSFSSDQTLEITKEFKQVILYQREFDTHANQWNYGLEQVRSDWVLSLDADYIATQELIQEIQGLDPVNPVEGYFIAFKYCVFGKPLRATILPPRLALFKPNKARYIDDGHTQLLRLDGDSKHLLSYIYHDDRKPLGRWLWAQDRYMVLETKKLLETPNDQLSWGDKIRKQKVIAPFIILLYCLIFKGGVLDGWAGWYYTFQRTLAELLLAIYLIEAEYLSKADDRSSLDNFLK